MKTKQRNKLSTESIAGLLHTKKLIGNDYCYTFPIDKKMLSYMNKQILFSSSSSNEN